MMLYVLKVDNSEKRINYTPLEVAAYRGGLNIFKVLLEGGANLDMKSRVCIISFMFVFHIWFNINVHIVDMMFYLPYYSCFCHHSYLTIINLYIVYHYHLTHIFVMMNIVWWEIGRAHV